MLKRVFHCPRKQGTGWNQRLPETKGHPHGRAGAYARGISWEILRKIMMDPAQRRDFLDFCYVYDQNPYVLGMGKDNLFAIGEK